MWVILILQLLKVTDKIFIQRYSRVLHSSDMSIIQKCMVNQMADIIIAITLNCPTPQQLLYLQEGVYLQSLKTLVNKNVLDI